MKRYNFNIEGYGYYIDSDVDLYEYDLFNIKKILSSFPHSSKSDSSIDKFLKFSLDEIPRHILTIAANAFDSHGNTMLGIVCEDGYSVEAVQKLINMGANLDTKDHNMNKLALHWAIGNKKSSSNRDSFEAAAVVECLLQKGARTDIKCYNNSTPLEYATNRGFTAAAKLIEAYSRQKQSENALGISPYSELISMSLFSSHNAIKPKDTSFLAIVPT